WFLLRLKHDQISAQHLAQHWKIDIKTEIQEKIIRAYAEKNDIEIVCTYADEGKSGMVATGRHSFQKLIADVENKEADLNFFLLLVYDVSRWGRYQRTDESAHYEHMRLRPRSYF
ncbi:MAG: recombinase family protein, partial [Magnetococcus sp. WYHC-3]